MRARRALQRAGKVRESLTMRKAILSLALLALAAPAVAASYPVSGRWGESNSAEKGPIDCTNLRVIAFNGEQRTDSKGGVPAYRNVSVTPENANFRMVDEFSNGQVNRGRVSYTLRKLDADHIVLDMARGGTLKLQRCK
jgi:hypothetical protein